MVWPLQKKCKTPREDDKFYELILDINDNPIIRRFWLKSRLRKQRAWRRDTSLPAEHSLVITIKFRVEGRVQEETFRHSQNGKEVTWSKNISGGIGGGAEEVRPISLAVAGRAFYQGKTWELACNKTS